MGSQAIKGRLGNISPQSIPQTFRIRDVQMLITSLPGRPYLLLRDRPEARPEIISSTPDPPRSKSLRSDRASNHRPFSLSFSPIIIHPSTISRPGDTGCPSSGHFVDNAAISECGHCHQTSKRGPLGHVEDRDGLKEEHAGGHRSVTADRFVQRKKVGSVFHFGRSADHKLVLRHASGFPVRGQRTNSGGKTARRLNKVERRFGHSV